MENESNINKKGVIRTYQSDAVEHLREGNISATGIAIAESKKRLEQQKEVKTKRKKSFVFVVGIIFLIAGISIITFLLLMKGDGHTNIVIPETSLVFSENQEILNVSDLTVNELISETIKTRDSASISLGSITNLVFVKEDGGISSSLTTEEFFNGLGIRAPGSLVRAVDQTYMFGIHAFDRNQMFLVFKVRSLQQAFAGMLDWERLMIDDLFGMFIEHNIQNTDLGIREVFGSDDIFEDVVMYNRDVRLINDLSGETRLLYTFPDPETLIITTNRNTLREILDRITTTRFRQS
jgi:hypothetical protein